MINILLAIVSVMLFTSCIHKNNTTVTRKLQEPKWLLNPYLDNNKVAAIGCSQIHFRGIEAQKNLAISRAIDRIAAQNSIIIDNVTYRQKSITNGRKANSKSTSSSLHSIDNLKVSTKIKAFFTKKNKEICVWVVQK